MPSLLKFDFSWIVWYNYYSKKEVLQRYNMSKNIFDLNEDMPEFKTYSFTKVNNYAQLCVLSAAEKEELAKFIEEEMCEDVREN